MALLYHSDLFSLWCRLYGAVSPLREILTNHWDGHAPRLFFADARALRPLLNAGRVKYRGSADPSSLIPWNP